MKLVPDVVLSIFRSANKLVLIGEEIVDTVAVGTKIAHSEADHVFNQYQLENLADLEDLKSKLAVAKAKIPSVPVTKAVTTS